MISLLSEMIDSDKFDAAFGGESYTKEELKQFKNESPIPQIDRYITMMNEIVTNMNQRYIGKDIEELQEKIKAVKHPVLKLTMNSVIVAYLKFVRRCA